MENRRNLRGQTIASIRMLAAIIPRHTKTMEEEIKKDIANYFLSDSRQFLSRYEILKPTQTEISNRSKLLIDIVFSFECSLKALIFIESELDERETYKTVRKCGHNLRNLIQVVDTSKIADIISVIDENFDHFSVGSRYTLDANIYFRNSAGALDNLYYSTIANFNWLETLYQNSKKLYLYVNSKIDNSIKTISFGDIDVEKELEKTRRIKQLNQK